MCNAMMNVEEQIKYGQLFNINICDSCAELVSRAYDDWHGGGCVIYERSDAEKAKKPISIKARLSVYKRDGFQCVKCGGNDLTIDHIIPIAKGGTNADNNLQTLCRSCNSKKGVKVK